MKRIICTLMGFAALTAGFDAAAAGRKTSVPEQKEQPTPRLRFTGDPFAQQATAVFAETLHDMRSKIEYGSNAVSYTHLPERFRSTRRYLLTFSLLPLRKEYLS